jgi:hypothetical protein
LELSSLSLDCPYLQLKGEGKIERENSFLDLDWSLPDLSFFSKQPLFRGNLQGKCSIKKNQIIWTAESNFLQWKEELFQQLQLQGKAQYRDSQWEVEIQGSLLDSLDTLTFLAQGNGRSHLWHCTSLEVRDLKTPLCAAEGYCDLEKKNRRVALSILSSSLKPMEKLCF